MYDIEFPSALNYFLLSRTFFPTFTPFFYSPDPEPWVAARLQYNPVGVRQHENSFKRGTLKHCRKLVLRHFTPKALLITSSV